MDSRGLFTPDHEAFRKEVRRFVDKELTPHTYEWEKAKGFPREIWKRAGELGFLCCDVPEQYGGAGADWLYNVIVIEELWRAGIGGVGSAFLVLSEVVTPYLMAGGSEELKKKWLPKMIAGEAIGALGLTEPGAGSDLQGLRTSAVRDGDDYVINGQKIFISNGMKCDFIVLACKTDPAPRSKGITLILVEADRVGFKKGRSLDKVGLHSQDIAELYFTDVRVPVTNRIGEEGKAFKILMGNLAQERLAQAVRSTTTCESAIEWTVKYTKDRNAFGRKVADFQNTHFVLAELDAKTAAARAYTDQCIRLHMQKQLSVVDAAKLKIVSCDLQGEVMDKCLQFFGGNGYMAEYPIARAWVDARMTRIGGGTIEVMKQIIGKDLMERY
jgi:alkylation response protein AidB-like acyl-CoA dehydrogenase